MLAGTECPVEMLISLAFNPEKIYDAGEVLKGVKWHRKVRQSEAFESGVAFQD